MHSAMYGELEILGEQIAEQAAHLDAATHRLLSDLRVFDERGGWRFQGARSCAHWLSWRVGWDLRTSRQYLAVAHKLPEVPAIDDALRRGEISYSKVRALVRVATPANEPLLLEYARLMTAAQLEVQCQKYALVQRHGEDPHPQTDKYRRYVCRRNTDDGMVKIMAVLHPEEAELVWTMLNHAATELTREPEPHAKNGSAEPDAAASASAASASAASTSAASASAASSSAASSSAASASAASSSAASSSAASSSAASSSAASAGSASSADVGHEITAHVVDGSAEPLRERRGAVVRSPDMAVPGPFPQARPAAATASQAVDVCNGSAELRPGAPATSEAVDASDRSAASRPGTHTGLQAVDASNGSAEPADRPDISIDSEDVPIDGVDVSIDGVDVSIDSVDVSIDGEDVSIDSVDVSADGLDAQVEATRGESLLDLLLAEAEGMQCPDSWAAEGLRGSNSWAAEDMRGPDSWAAESMRGPNGWADPECEPGFNEETAERHSFESHTPGVRPPSVLQQREDATTREFNRADALVSIAQGYLRGERRHRSPIEITLTMPASSLHAEQLDPVEVARMGETCVAPSTVRRLACDAGVVEVVEDDRGTPLSVGRKRRTIAGALKRALYQRDRTCTYPGCTHRLFLEGHHIRHWADGGETSLENTALLCSHHHRYVHEYGYTIELSPDQRPQFRDPHGRVVPEVPPRPAPPDLGWPTIRARNAPLGIDANTIACEGTDKPPRYGAIVEYLVVADRQAGDASSRQAPKAC